MSFSDSAGFRSLSYPNSFSRQICADAFANLAELKFRHRGEDMKHEFARRDAGFNLFSYVHKVGACDLRACNDCL